MPVPLDLFPSAPLPKFDQVSTQPSCSSFCRMNFNRDSFYFFRSFRSFKLHNLNIMQFNVVFITTALLASASLAMSATVTVFAGADCTGSQSGSTNVPTGFCGTLGSSSAKSIRYSGVPNQIQFYISGGGHDNCTNGSSLTRGAGSGCATAPAG